MLFYLCYSIRTVVLVGDWHTNRSNRGLIPYLKRLGYVQIDSYELGLDDSERTPTLLKPAVNEAPTFAMDRILKSHAEIRNVLSQNT